MTRRTIIIVLLTAGASIFVYRSQRPTPTNSTNNVAAPTVIHARTIYRTQTLDEAIDAIRASSDDLARAEAIDLWLSGISDDEIRLTLEHLMAQEDSPLRRELRSRLIRRWAEIDVKGAADWAAKLAVGLERQAALNDVAISWANENLSESIAWARELPEEDRNNALVKIAYEAVESNPMQALQLAAELPATEARDELVAQTSANWAANDAKTASEWALQIPDKNLREHALSGIAASWSEQDPKSAAELALQSIEPGRAQNDAVVSIVQRWSQKDAASAGAWVAQFPEGSLRNTAAEELIKQWADQNSNKAAEWLETLPESRTRDRAIGAFVSKIVADNPQLAARWASNISEEYQRNLELERIAEAWFLRDPGGARAWLGQSGLPDSVQKRVQGIDK